LDELGLIGALRQYAGNIGQGDSVTIHVDAPHELPPLPAAVEVAAYRIVQEAVTNVVRHAAARTCAISLAVIQRDADVVALTIDVRDDGTGLPENYRAGVGVLGMRERAAELGGTCVIDRLVPHGTAVSAYLPTQWPALEE
jgi:signal transduction histidine kinase